MSVISQHEGPSGCEADRARSGWAKPTSQWLASGLIAADLQQLAEIHIIEQRLTTENRLPTRPEQRLEALERYRPSTRETRI